MKSRPEGAAAAARRFRIRVVEHETAADETRVVVEHGPVQEQQALPVDENPGAVRPFEHRVAETRLPLPGEGITQTRAAAALHADTQTALVEALPGHQRPDLACGRLSDLDHALGWAVASADLSTPFCCFFR